MIITEFFSWLGYIFWSMTHYPSIPVQSFKAYRKAAR